MQKGAAARAARPAAAAASQKGHGDEKVMGMTVEEAKMILNTRELCPEEIEKKKAEEAEILNEKNSDDDEDGEEEDMNV